MQHKRYYAVLTFSLLFCSELYAANLTIDSASDLGSDGLADGIIMIQPSNPNASYQGLYSGMKTSDSTSAGILSNSSNNGKAWIISSDSNITSTDNRVGVRVNANGKILFEGNGSNSLNVDNNAGVDGFGVGLASYSGEITVNNMNITANGNANHGLQVDNGKINITSKETNNLTANNNTNGINATSGGEINITNYNVTASHNTSSVAYASGIFAHGGSKINITGSDQHKNMLILEGNTSRGIWAYNSSAEVNIKNMDLIVNNNRWGIFAGADSTINIIGGEQRNTLIANDNTSYAFVSQGTNAILNVKNMDVFITHRGAAITAENGGVVNLINTNISVTSGAALFSHNRSGIYNFTNTFIESSINQLMRANATNTDLNAENSILIGNANIYADGENLNFSIKNTSWGIRLNSILTDLKMQDSTIDLRNLNDSVFNTLTVKNLAMAGNNIFYLNTYLDGDGTSTDKIIVDGGEATGKGTLFVTTTGNNEEQSVNNGILVVDLTNATDKSAIFDLYGGVIDAGFYEYGLHQASDENWYLQSNDKMSTIAKMMSNIPAMHLSIVKAGMSELRKRMGELRDNEPTAKDGAWVRSYAKHMNIDEAINSSMNLYGIEAGYDHQVYGDCYNKLFAGMAIGYLYNDDMRFKSTSLAKGSGNSDTVSAGLYATWLNKYGWFTDAVIRSFWSEIDINTSSSQGQKISTKPERQFTTFSLETGRQLMYKATESSNILLEPKIELAYAYAKGKEFQTSTLSHLYYGSTQSFMTRAALAVNYQTNTENGMIVTPFIEFGLNQEWDGKTDVEYDNGFYRSDVSGFSYDVSIGLNAKLNKKWNLYSDITYETGSVIETTTANLGMRYSW